MKLKVRVLKKYNIFIKNWKQKEIKEKETFKVNQIHKIGMNLIFLPPKMFHLVHLLHQHSLRLLEIHQNLLVAVVLLKMIFCPQNLQLINVPLFTLILFIMMANFQTSEHELQNWVVQLLKDVRPDEKNKIGGPLGMKEIFP